MALTNFLGFGIIKVEQGRALVVSRVGSDKVDVTFTGRVVLPVVHKAEFMDISVKTIEIDRRGKDGLICQDNIRADIKVTFFVRVNKTKDDVIKVAQAIGCDRASKTEILEALFAAKFSEALKTVGKQLDFVDLYTKRDDFRDRIIEVIGRDLNGYSLEDAAIDYLEQTPIGQLDPQNILDAQGIRKITELTAIEHVKTNEFQNNEKKLITKQDVEAAEAILELERQKADAMAKQTREIETMKAREQAETAKVQAEERLRSEQARIRSDEQIGVLDENKQREIAVALKNRERVIAVETERVEKDRALEAISRERETELQRIAKDKELEVEKRAIADVIRERIAVDKTVAEQEEAIKRLRVVEEADRNKEATVIAAAAEAEQKLIKDIKAAEAAEKAAHHLGQEELILADARLQAADKQAQAKIRMAEGIKAETAAAGLAEVQVKEADAAATEKQGRAEGAVIRARLEGEAAGLTEKAAAMRALDDASRLHEEYRLRLEALKEVELEGIRTRERIAEHQAAVLGAGLQNAKIDIVGGESMFVDRLVNAIGMGKSADAVVDKSSTLRTAFGDYLGGERSLSQDLKDVLTRPALGATDVANLTIAGVLAGLMRRGGSEEVNGKLGALLERARELGIADAPLGGRGDGEA